MSEKLTLIAVWRMRASPAAGVGSSTSSQRITSGPPWAWMRIAFDVLPIAAAAPSKQLVDREGARDDLLLDRVLHHQLERLAVGLHAHGMKVDAVGAGRHRLLAFHEQPVDLAHHVGARVGQRLGDHEIMVHRHGAVFLRPGLRLLVRIGEQVADVCVVLGEVGCRDQRVHVAVEQHLVELLGAWARALDDRRIAVLGDVGIVGADPADAGKIDAVLVLEDAAHPDAGRLRVGAHGDAAAFHVLGAELAARGIVDDEVVLEARHHHGGQQHERPAVGLGLEKAADGELARVEGALVDHRLEALVGSLRPAEIELHQIGADLARLQGAHDRDSRRDWS